MSLYAYAFFLCGMFALIKFKKSRCDSDIDIFVMFDQNIVLINILFVREWKL